MCEQGPVTADSCAVGNHLVGEDESLWVKAHIVLKPEGKLLLTLVVPAVAQHNRRGVHLRSGQWLKGSLWLSKCSDASCQAFWTLDKAEVEQLLSSKQMVIEYSVSELSGIRLLVPLMGLKEAVAAWQAEIK